MSDFHQALPHMEQVGGEFVKRLAHLWRAGDPVNRAKLEECFSDYFERYALLAVNAAKPPCGLEAHATVRVDQ